jgi:hypothetical protein
MREAASGMGSLFFMEKDWRMMIADRRFQIINPKLPQQSGIINLQSEIKPRYSNRFEIFGFLNKLS